MFNSLYNWALLKKENEIDETLIEQFNISPLAKNFLEKRGFIEEKELESILAPKFGDYNDIYDMDKATALIKKHIEEGSTILIYGDYDADGITSTALLYTALLQATENVHFFIPNRVEHGYGPNYDFFLQEVVGNVDLVITVDNGVTAVKEINLLLEHDIDVVVIDHHTFGEEKPNCIIIHPDHPEGQYSDKALAGVGITYKVVEALGLLKEQHIGFAAIGTIADMVPMFGENKRIVIDGLKYLNQNLPVGLRALMTKNNSLSEIDTETIGFFLAPRLNSTGRIGEASMSVELLLTEDLEYAEMLASEIEELNEARKEMVETTVLEAKNQISTEDKVQIIYSEDWHPGILGIVASRIVEAVGVPTILLTRDEGVYKGSSRSIDGIDFLEYLNQVDSTHTAHGHAAAFGITVPEEDIESFKTKSTAHMNTHLKEIKPTKYIDMVLRETFTEEHLRELHQLGPFGQGFSTPLFEIENNTIAEIRQIGRDKNHIKFKMKETSFDFIGFNLGKIFYDVAIDDKISAIGKINVNVFNGNRKLQMLVEDVKMNDFRFHDMRAKNDQNFDLIKSTDIFLIQEGKKKLGDNYFFYGEKIPFIVTTLVLRDLPIDLKAFEHTMAGLKVAKVIAIFNEKDELFFQGIPRENTVRNAYQMIINAKNGAIDLKVHAEAFSKKLNITMSTLEKVIAILVDLNRIKLENNVVFFNPDNTSEILINESKYYRGLQNKLASEAKLKMTSRPEIKNYLEDLITREEN